MAELWRGAPVAAALTQRLTVQRATLAAAGITPTLAIVRVGARAEDLSYERGALNRCEKVGISVKSFTLPHTCTQEELLNIIVQINGDPSIHGCLLFRPLPRHLDERAICQALSPAKDIDGITDASLARILSGIGAGYPPCTAQACVELLAHYGCELTGKRAVVVGRSLVIGKPVALLLLEQNATVTICHTRTADMEAICRQAEVLVVAAGRAGAVGKLHLSPNQIVVDVGINEGVDGTLVGDVEFAAADTVAAITPVPGGVGGVTTSVLAQHVLDAAARANGISIERKNKGLLHINV